MTANINAEDFVNSIMDSLPESNTSFTISVPKEKKRVKRSEANDEGGLPTSSPLGEDERVPIVCDPITPDDAVLPQMLKDGESARNIYDKLILQMAEESVHLKKLREALGKHGIPFSKVSRDIVTVLKDLTDVMEKKAKEQALSGGGAAGKIDFKSENFQRVFQWFLAQIKGACKDGHMPEHSEQLLFAKLQQRMNGFEDVAEELYYGDESAATKKRKTTNVKV